MSLADCTALPPAPTVLLYHSDETLREHVTCVTSMGPYDALPPEQQLLFKAAVGTHESTSACSVVESKETIFYVQGGGQPCDTGYMTPVDQTCSGKFHVEAVRSCSDGRVLHFGTFQDQSMDHFTAGERIKQHVDDATRNLNSRSHTAGHIVGLAVRHLTMKENRLAGVTELKASHFPGACFVEFKGIIDGIFREGIQAQASEYVQAALPIKVLWYKPEELEEKGVVTPAGMPVVSGMDGYTRVVDIVGAGAYPCGGTHIQHTDLVGKLVVKGIKRQRGISKVSYAVED